MIRTGGTSFFDPRSGAGPPGEEMGMALRRAWRGASGASYLYWIVKIGSRLNAVHGNFIFAKPNATGGWDAIYVGEGELSCRTDLGRQFKGVLIRSKGATHIHIRPNPDPTARLIEKADILDGNPEAYAPMGCNEPAA